MIDYANQIVQNDLKEIADARLPWDDLNGKTIFVAGATGMLASYITWFLCYLNEKKGINVKVITLCRSEEKSRKLFIDFADRTYFSSLLQDVCCPIKINENVDYIFHLAGNASPYFIKSDPVGIMKANLLGTINVLELAKDKKAKVLYASTREVYGEIKDLVLLKEDDFGYINTMDARSCYPESKRAAETLMKSYYVQYGVESCTARIAHSYGPTMNMTNDGRVMADFMGDLMTGRDLVLKSKGDAERAFIYITDAVLGLFTVLFKGKACYAYNLSNEDEPITIKDLAKKLLSLNGNETQELVIKNQEDSRGYCTYKRVGLDTTEIRLLGWKPSVSLQEGLTRIIKAYKEK